MSTSPLDLAANSAVFLIAALHLYILVLEMFLWTHPLGLRAFGLSQEQAESTRAMAANQGLYNGFLTAGLGWSLLDEPYAFQLRVFFLGCVLVAGLFGAATAKLKILFIQALPAAMALGLVLAAR